MNMSSSPIAMGRSRRALMSAGMLVLASLAAPHAANAGFNANIAGVVTMVNIYMYSDSIYLTLSNQPSSHPGCNPTYFVIPSTVTQNVRSQAFAALVAARLTGEPIHIGYDSTGDCAEGYIQVFRVGL
jgi:hypothetical protein